MKSLTAARPPTLSLLLGGVAVLLVYLAASSYLTFLLTGAVVSIVVMQSFGVITGRAGVISLCQMSFAAIGAWTVGWANVGDVPGGFVVWLVLGGLAAVVAGLAIGLPALRLRGMSLAVATFAFATSLDVVFGAINFPGQDEFNFVARPEGFTSDSEYFVFAALVAAALFLLLWKLDRSRMGGVLIEIRHSERAAAAHGISVARGKLAAFALSAFIAGVAGGLMAGQLGVVSATNFTSATSVSFFAIALFIGTHNPEGALLGGLLGAVFPVLIDQVGIPQDLSAMFFGVAAILILRHGKSQTDDIRSRHRAKRAKRQAQEQAKPVAPARTEPVAARRPGNHESGVDTEGRPPVLETRELRVRFGNLVAVDGVTLSVPARTTVGLVGPNGAGKSTLVNAVTGFVDGYGGSVVLGGRALDGMPAHRRARAGVRRSFQQLRVPDALNVGMFLQVAAGKRLPKEEIDEQLAWFGCPPAYVPMEAVDVATRRLLEVAGLAAGAPPVLLLDEPAAGHSSGETRLLASRLAEIPERSDTSVLLIEHDIELVRAVCDELVVLDFGRVIAQGPPERVLREEAVLAAYLGGSDLNKTPETR
ncbi:ABC transporter permease subunit [Amycolatopsis cihanbeyliensis]|uniref:Amino acid/amide ABC transporter membrane protein 2 (HAAT family) /amino acid/amide ABC transporter ATP-binding protein 1 (HAAT family) n=1 Tax=Amycolatopsis cihanbeyliensis TaxID=1128664 RepID=A0A542CSH4_AMYCI|nr:ATP-binding cassette domain-containing protein [Amycolatopsis cihanbeyliensis]TQI93771.1 amino acid/amide ABC transporter membrane protein 2 (HAAT family) /amino acid/amide ABC transporter ATP-binding protein 1 (HAAT family) [Amycolatopsis cihanbeyliensis]